VEAQQGGGGGTEGGIPLDCSTVQEMEPSECDLPPCKIYRTMGKPRIRSCTEPASIAYSVVPPDIF
jgi:hypothetical protein